jgi:hypothetical protein
MLGLHPAEQKFGAPHSEKNKKTKTTWHKSATIVIDYLIKIS